LHGRFIERVDEGVKIHRTQIKPVAPGLLMVWAKSIKANRIHASWRIQMRERWKKV
jgi:hypothetical protein